MKRKTTVAWIPASLALPTKEPGDATTARTLTSTVKESAPLKSSRVGEIDSDAASICGTGSAGATPPVEEELSPYAPEEEEEESSLP